MDKVTIANEYLSVTATLHGGTLTDVIDLTANEQLLYQPDERAWDGQDVIIFPFVARLQDKYYTVDGRRYDMEIHGLAPYNDFIVEQKSSSSVTLALKSTKLTRKSYPYDFILRVTYSVDGRSLTTELSVENTGSEALPFMLGGHPAYRLDCVQTTSETDTSGNFIIIPKREYEEYTLDERGCFVSGVRSVGVLESLEMNKDFFRKHGTFLIKDFEGTLLLRRHNRTLKFELGKLPVLALWSLPDYGDYVCIEPWFGHPDTQPPTREITAKPLINRLPIGQTFTYKYTMQA